MLKEEIPELRFEIYGEGAYRDELVRLTEELGVEGHVYFSDGFVPMNDLLRAISAADVGVVAMKRDVFRDLTHCNKMYDFIAMRVPAIVSRTRSVRAYFPESCFRYVTPGDVTDLAEAIRELHASPDLRRHLVEEAARVNEPYRWPHQRGNYLAMVEALLDGRDVESPTGAVHRAEHDTRSLSGARS